MKQSLLFVVTSVVFLCCTKDASLSVAPDPDALVHATIDSIAITDSTIRAFAYGPAKYPAGFYMEDHGEIIIYEDSHSILSLPERTGIPHELCTDSIAEARGWSEAAAANKSGSWELRSERATSMYFEFRWANASQVIVRSRIHRQAYVDRSMYPLDPLDPYPSRPSPFAVLNGRPIDTSSVRMLVEYLWFVNNYDMGGNIVVAGVMDRSSDSIRYALYHLSVSYGDVGLKDAIVLRRSLYSVSPWTGQVVASHRSIRMVQGKLNQD